MEFTDYDTRLAAYAVIVDQRDRVLLALWNEPEVPTWTLPGGGVELHESPEEGVLREVREETGYDVALGRLLGVVTRVTPAERRADGIRRPLRHVHVAYEATVVGGRLTPEVDGTTDEARWIARADLPALVRSSQVRNFLA